MNRVVDKTKKSNRKCEHCKFYTEDKEVIQRDYEYGSRVFLGVCKKKQEGKNYWNCCKDFCWNS